MKFYIVDAFTENVFGGNPAGVVILPEGADFPSDEICIKTAAELRYSETAFIKILKDGHFNIRYFTPVAEVDLCGHATVASFTALIDAGFVKNGFKYINHTLAGDLDIEIKDGFILMDMATPKFIGEISEINNIKELYRIMGIDYKTQLDKGLTLKPQLISTGLPDIMMPVATLEDLNALSPDMYALAELSKKYEVTGVHAFTLEGEDATCHARNFAPLYDIDEEAATGTSNGALTYYGYLNGFIQSSDNSRFIQGEKMGRPSLILSTIEELSKDTKECKIRVGGNSAILAKGEIHI